MAGALPLESVIGFEGKVSGGLVLHPNGKTMAGPFDCGLCATVCGHPAVSRERS
jgi:hypothetical protein